MVSKESERLSVLRQEVRDWLEANLPEGWGTPEYVAPMSLSREAHELGKAWTKKLYDAGYTGFGYPKEYGGIERPINFLTWRCSQPLNGRSGARRYWGRREGASTTYLPPCWRSWFGSVL